MKKAVKLYVGNEPFETISMGMLSKRYEEAIQRMAYTIMARLVGHNIVRFTKRNKETINRLADQVVDELDKYYGYSGNQVGAAKNMVSVILDRGYDEAIAEMKKQNPSRIIVLQNGRILNWKDND